MASIAFALPVADSEKGMKFVEELAAGGRKGEHHAARGQHGFTRIKVFRQHEPREMVVIYMEAPNIEEALKARAGAGGEFEEWFEKTYEAVTGHHPDFHGGKAPSTLLFDWHEEKGHSHGKEHAEHARV